MRIAKMSAYLFAALLFAVTACYGGDEAGSGEAAGMDTAATGAMSDTTQVSPEPMAEPAAEPDSANP